MKYLKHILLSLCVLVELADGQKKDFKVSKKHGKKVLKGLQNCWRSLK